MAHDIGAAAVMDHCQTLKLRPVGIREPDDKLCPPVRRDRS